MATDTISGARGYFVMVSDVQSASEIAVGGDIAALLQQVDENVERVNRLRPFDKETASKIRTAFLPDRVTATLNIEGIAATRRQTLAIMDALVLSQQVAKEDREIVNALKADGFVFDCFEHGAELDVALIRQINQIVLQDIKSEAGQFRTGTVEISGADFSPPNPHEIQPMIERFVEAFKDTASLHSIIQAAWVHHSVAYIHPFIDGNGRTCRLLQDFALMKRGLFPIAVPSSQRDTYYHALQRADAGKWDDLVSLLAQNQLATLGKIEGIAAETKERADWISGLARLANEKKTGALYKQYVVWKTRMEQIRDAFCRASAELDDATDVIGATERWYEVLEFEDWKVLTSTGRRPGFTWLFSLLFFVDGEPMYKLIGFFSRHKADPLDFSADLKEVVSLNFTGLPAKTQQRPDFQNFSDPDIRLREIMYVNDQMYVVHEKDNARLAPKPSTVEEVIKSVFEDVFYRKGNLAG